MAGFTPCDRCEQSEPALSLSSLATGDTLFLCVPCAVATTADAYQSAIGPITVTAEDSTLASGETAGVGTGAGDSPPDSLPDPGSGDTPGAPVQAGPGDGATGTTGGATDPLEPGPDPAGDDAAPAMPADGGDD